MRSMHTGEVTSETPIPSLLGIVEGDLLEYLEAHGPTSVYRLVQSQDWPAPLVLMAVGALARQGLVRGSERQLELVLDEAHASLAA